MWAIYGLPILGGVYHASNLILKLLYMYTKIASPSICMLLAGIGYKRQQNSEQSTFLTPLATLIYILRFMQWWQEEGQQALKRNQEIPTAPTDFPNHHPSSGLVDVPGKCPICWDIPKKPVSLTSGRVFCEKCLLLNKVYTEERCCPVSLDQVKQYLPLFVDSTH